MSAAMFGWFLVSALYLQSIMGYDALQVGLAFLPATLLMGAMSLGVSAKIVMRFGIRWPLVHAAGDDAERAAARGDEAEDAHRLRALTRLGEEAHDQRERDGRDGRAGDPCTARAPTSIPFDWASPQTSEEIVKSAIPPRKTRRGPNRSPARPPSSKHPPKVSTYALTTNASVDALKSRFALIEGSATFTIVTSRTIIRSPRQKRVGRATWHGCSKASFQTSHRRPARVMRTGSYCPAMAYQPPPEIIDRYADVLVNFALNEGRGDLPR